MIQRKTTLVLGAGASKPYGFPTGAELKKCILEGSFPAQDPDERAKFYPITGHPKFREFREKFLNSPAFSIDRFLYFHKDLQEIGKTLIAFYLYLSSQPKYIGQENENWYQYFFNCLAEGCKTIDAFSKNRVNVITFNYDVSFEWELSKFIENYFNCTIEVAHKYAKEIHVHHIHGHLGPLPWDDLNLEVPYHHGNDNISFIKYSKDIQLVHEGEDPYGRIYRRYRDIISEARNIFFLGFGFHPENLEKLFNRIDTSDIRFDNGGVISQMIASTLGQAGGETRAWKNTFIDGLKIEALHMDSCALLKEKKDILTYANESDFKVQTNPPKSIIDTDSLK